MASQEQRRAAKKNIKKAIKAAKRKQTLKHLPEENPSSSRQASCESQTITKVASALAPQSRRVHRVHSQHLWSTDSPTLAVEVISGEVNKSITQAWPYNSRLMLKSLKL